ncbi:hypothetical protein ABID59_003317 [Bradyrhizobium sp. S3.3.6]|uniref:hypothetical protein n=1 Tax=Bradyrhizobium sp. S3.3.6 TaxID=3156429 RepID=UPI0033928242
MTGSYLRVPRLLLPATVALIIVHLGLCGLLWFTPEASYSIAPSQIQPEIGQAYYADTEYGTGRVYRFSSDSPETPTASSLLVFEDGRAIGPPHSAHDDVRRKGGGRFSHWGARIIFSTTDGTDPRSNGRTYSVTASFELKPQLQRLLVTVLTLADLAFLLHFRMVIIFALQKWGVRILAGFAVLLVLLAALSGFGLLGTIVVAKNGPPKDVALVVQILQHALLGCMTSIGIWAAGAGITRLMLRNRRSSLAEILIPAFPVGLALLAVLVVVALVVPWGRSIAFALWLACLVPLRKWRPPGQQVTAALKAALAIFPLAIAFGIWLALLWHGPTDTLAASPSGDLTFYAGSIWSLASQPYPYFDLGYANGESRGYFNNLYPAFGATLLYLPYFDPFLFLLASGGTSYVLLSALMVHFYVTDRVSRSIDPFELLLVTLSVVVAARYPYWVAESIPMVVVPALTISVWWMADRGRHSYRWSLAAMLAGLTGSFISKVVTAAVLVPLGSIGIWSRVRSLPLAAHLLMLAIVGAFAVYSSLMLLHYMPMFVATANPGPESYRTPQWYFVSRDIGAVLMAALAWVIADAPVALALCFGMITFIAFSWVFQANFVCVSIVLGLLLISVRPSPIFARVLALAAFTLSLPALVLGYQAGASSGVIWIVCLGGATLAAILSALDATTVEPRVTVQRTAVIAMTTLAVTALGLIGVSRGSIIADSGWHLTQREPLTPALKEIWSAVRERTPVGALIFTDQVDETENVLGGWNTYAYSGQRQLYLSSYYTGLELRHNRQKLDQILATNKTVLEGSRAPQSVPTRRSYGSFYAVVSASKAVPRTWRQVFRNDQYALYEIVA